MILHANMGLPAPGNPSGISMRISSLILPFKKAIITSICHRGQLYFATSAKMMSIVDHLTIGAKTSLKSIPSLCWNPQATILTLNLLIFPFEFRLILKSHFAVIGLQLVGRRMTVQVSFFRIESILLLIALRHSSY